MARSYLRVHAVCHSCCAPFRCAKPAFFMKTRFPAISVAVNPPAPSEQEISDYAFHLYQQGNCEHGHDLDHWREASACLIAGAPRTTASV